MYVETGATPVEIGAASVDGCGWRDGFGGGTSSAPVRTIIYLINWLFKWAS